MSTVTSFAAFLVLLGASDSCGVQAVVQDARVNLPFGTLPAEQADVYSVQGVRRGELTMAHRQVCKSERAVVFQQPAYTFRIPMLFDESGGTGTGYDTLHMDLDEDGNLLNDPVYKAVPYSGGDEARGRPLLAYFQNVRICGDREKQRYATVQVFLQGERGEATGCTIIPQKWAVGTVAVDGKQIPAALIDRNWNDRYDDLGGLDLEEHPGRFPRGDCLVLAIDGEEALIPPGKSSSTGKGGSVRGVLTAHLLLDSGVYRVNAEQVATGVKLELNPADVPSGKVVLSSVPDEGRIVLMGTNTCALVRKQSLELTLPVDTYFAPGYGNETVTVEAGKILGKPDPVALEETVRVVAAPKPDQSQQPEPEWSVNTLEGRVVSHADHKPVPNAQVAVVLAGKGSISYRGPRNVTAQSRSARTRRFGFLTKPNEREAALAETDAEGGFVIKGLKAGRLTLLAVHAERGIAIAKDVEHPEQGQLLEVVLQPPTFVEGTIKGLPGTSTSRHASLYHRSFYSGVSTRLDLELGADGRFRIGPVPAAKLLFQTGATWRLSVAQYVRAREFSADLLSVPVEIEVGKTTTLNIDMTTDSRIAGQVIGPAGEPLANVSVVARAKGPKSCVYGTVTDIDGKYAVTGLADGDYNLEAKRYAPRSGPG